MDELRIKEILSPFLHMEPEDMDDDTVMDSSVIRMSILLRRMYATLAKEGYGVANPKSIRTFGDLISGLSSVGKGLQVENKAAYSVNPSRGHGDSHAFGTGGSGIGIDIEEVRNMPVVNDYREDAFYQENFTPIEVSYCILQKDPVVSFAGKFSAKEAIIKADHSYENVPLNRIEILNDEHGKPCFGDFLVSISHTAGLSVAVAVKSPGEPKSQKGEEAKEQAEAISPDKSLIGRDTAHSGYSRTEKLALFLSAIALGASFFALVSLFMGKM